MDCYSTKQNTDELLVSNYNAVSNNTVTNAFDDENTRVAIDYDSKLELSTPVHYAAHGAIDPGFQHVVIDTLRDSDIQPIVIQPNDFFDSRVNSGGGMKPEICDFNSQEQACDHVYYNCNDKTTSLPTTEEKDAKIGGKTETFVVKYEDIDEQLIKDVKIKQESAEELAKDLSNFVGPETNKLDETFQSSGKGGVISVKCEDSREVKIESEASNIKECPEEKALIDFDMPIKNEPELKNRRRRKGFRFGPKPKNKSAKRQSNDRESQKPFCKLCQKEFSTVQALKYHNKRHDKKKQHVCKICGLRYVDIGTLKCHMRGHSSPEESYYPCGVCGKSYTTAKQLGSHAKHHKIKDKIVKRWETCDICGETVEKGGLKGHKGKFHFHTCSKCGKRYSNEQNLALHRCYKDVKPVICVFCGAVFSSDYGLQNHMTSHVAEPNHVCHLCGEGFLHIRHLDWHFVASHRKEKCYNCNTCEFKFKKRRHLLKHQELHSKREAITLVSQD